MNCLKTISPSIFASSVDASTTLPRKMEKKIMAITYRIHLAKVLKIAIKSSGKLVSRFNGQNQKGINEMMDLEITFKIRLKSLMELK